MTYHNNQHVEAKLQYLRVYSLSPRINEDIGAFYLRYVLMSAFPFKNRYDNDQHAVDWGLRTTEYSPKSIY